MSSPRRTKTKTSKSATPINNSGHSGSFDTSPTSPTSPSFMSPFMSTATANYNSDTDLAYSSCPENVIIEFPETSNHPLQQQHQSILQTASPRRSPRLLEKTLKPDLPLESTKSVCDFYFFKNEPTSDYGSSKHSTNSKPNFDISDEISNLSLEDVNLVQPKTVKLIKIKDCMLLMPYHTVNDEQPIITESKELTLSAVKYFENLDLIITPTGPVFKIEKYNYYNSINPPIITVPIPTSSKSIKIYQFQDPDWVPILRMKPLNDLISFTFQPETNYLITITEPIMTKKSRIQPDQELRFKISKHPTQIIITYPKNSVNTSTTTRAILYSNQLDLDNQIIINPLGSFILALTPHGLKFNKNIHIQIEIIHYQEIKKIFPTANILLFQSEDGIKWVRIQLFLINKNFIQFYVQHFSFFKVVWDLVASSLTSAKIGLSTLFTTTVGMKCQVTMDEFENNRFGLEVSIYKAEKPFPEVQNYNHIVGRSLPKLVKPGRLTLALKSKLFKADMEAGEDQEMVKQEEFKGQDFCKDFALRFKEDVKIERGPFGKVVVTRKESKETIFEFNIQKQGNENEASAESLANNDKRDRWSMMALQELATSLFITDGDNWKLLARNIGFTKQEIKSKFKDSSDPFKQILESYKSRGGTPEEFIKSLYEVHREMKMRVEYPVSNSSRKTSTKSSGYDSNLSNNKHYIKSDTDDFSPGSESPHDSIASGTKKRPRPKRLNPIKLKKRKFDLPLTSEGDSTSENEEPSISKSGQSSNMSLFHRRDQTKLENGFFWSLTPHLTNNLWKALGRTLHVEEPNLVNIEQTHKSSGNRECYYQVLVAWREQHPKQCTFSNLYNALKKEKMDNAAKEMTNIENNDRF